MTRFIAAVLDLILLAVVALVITVPIALLYAFSLLSTGSLGYFGYLFGPVEFALFVLFVIYFTYFESTSGQTLGKRAMHLQVVYVPTGRPPDLGRSLVRNLLRIIDWLPFLYLLGFVVGLVTDRKQRIGDIVADTIVIRV